MPPPAPAPAAATTQPASKSAVEPAAAGDRRVILHRRMPRNPPKPARRLPCRILREYTWLADPPATMPQPGACYPDHRIWGPERQSLGDGTDPWLGQAVVRGEARRGR